MTTKKQNQDYFFTLVSYLYISEYINYFKQSHKKRSSDKIIFFHFHTPFYKIGGVLFGQHNIISLKIGWFLKKIIFLVASVILICHIL